MLKKDHDDISLEFRNGLSEFKSYNKKLEKWIEELSESEGSARREEEVNDLHAEIVAHKKHQEKRKKKHRDYLLGFSQYTPCEDLEDCTVIDEGKWVLKEKIEGFRKNEDEEERLHDLTWNFRRRAGHGDLDLGVCNGTELRGSESESLREKRCKNLEETQGFKTGEHDKKILLTKLANGPHKFAAGEVDLEGNMLLGPSVISSSEEEASEEIKESYKKKDDVRKVSQEEIMDSGSLEDLDPEINDEFADIANMVKMPAAFDDISNIMEDLEEEMCRLTGVRKKGISEVEKSEDLETKKSEGDWPERSSCSKQETEESYKEEGDVKERFLGKLTESESSDYLDLEIPTRFDDVLPNIERLEEQMRELILKSRKDSETKERGQDRTEWTIDSEEEIEETYEKEGDAKKRFLGKLMKSGLSNNLVPKNSPKFDDVSADMEGREREMCRSGKEEENTAFGELPIKEKCGFETRVSELHESKDFKVKKVTDDQSSSGYTYASIAGVFRKMSTLISKEEKIQSDQVGDADLETEINTGGLLERFKH